MLKNNAAGIFDPISPLSKKNRVVTDLVSVLLLSVSNQKH